MEEKRRRKRRRRKGGRRSKGDSRARAKDSSENLGEKDPLGPIPSQAVEFVDFG